MKDIHIKVITTDSEFDKVQDEWISFEKKINNQNITSSYIWQRTWWNHFKDYEKRNFGYDKKLCILFLYSKKNILRAIVPFCEVVRKIKGLKYRVIEFLAQQWGATYLDITTDKLSEEEYNFIFSWLKKNRKFDLIELKYIPEFTPNFDLNKSNATVLSACPEIISDSYDSVRNNCYGKNLRKTLRRIRNKIGSENIDLTTSYLSSGEILTRFEEIKEVSFSKKLNSKHSIYCNTRIEGFVRSLVDSFSENAMCFFIDYNGKAVAYKLGFRYNGKYYALDTAYSRSEREVRNLCLGELNYDYLIQCIFDRGVKNLCLGTGVDPHKFKFTKQITRIYTFLKRGNTLKALPLYIIKKRWNKRIEKKFNEELKRNLKRD